MARDDFKKYDIDRLAKRVGMRCSNPECRMPTSGPDSREGVINVGVAAHITAASPGGPRYDESLTSESRSSVNNGIWLCQTHAKLIDDDELTFTSAMLHDWKDTAEKMAGLEAKGYSVALAAPFARLDKQVPKLIAEMREDLQKNPLVRQFVILSNKVTYNGGDTPIFMYFLEDHDSLMSVMTIMEHTGAVYDTQFNRVPRYNFTEEFVEHLIGVSS